MRLAEIVEHQQAPPISGGALPNKWEVQPLQTESNHSMIVVLVVIALLFWLWRSAKKARQMLNAKTQYRDGPEPLL